MTTKLSPWDKGLAALNEWLAAGGSPSPKRTDKTASGFPIGQWVDARRRDYRDGKLSADRIAVLEAIDGWVWDPHEHAWQTSLDALRAWADEHGDVVLGQRADDEAERELASWVKKQRAAFRAGTLAADRVEALESIDVWVWKPGETSWAAAYANLLRYVELNGDALVPAGFETTGEYPTPGHKLGVWVMNQRQHFRRNGALKGDRAAKLEAVASWAWASAA